MNSNELYETINGKISIYGVIINHIGEIKKNSWSASTREEYFRSYTNILAPKLNKSPIDEITRDDIKEAIHRIQTDGFYTGGKKQLYQPESMKKFIYLINVLFEFAIIAGYIKSSPLWGTDALLPALTSFETHESKQQLNPRFLTEMEEFHIADQIFTDPNQIGELTGILLMWSLGLRNAEACGVNFGDIQEIENHPGTYSLVIYKTTMRNSNQLKLSGKTKNANRRMPLSDKLASFLLDRKAHLHDKCLTDPERFKGVSSVSDIDYLPIVCKGDRFTVRCDANDLTKAGKEVLRNAKVDPNILGYLELELNNSWKIAGEKESTSYLFRRNFATHLENLGLTKSEKQYLMGHDIKSSDVNRNEFSNSERLFIIKLKLENRPILSDQYLEDKEVKFHTFHTKVRQSSGSSQTLSFWLPQEIQASVDIKVRTVEPHAYIKAKIEVKQDNHCVTGRILTTQGDAVQNSPNMIPFMHNVYAQVRKKYLSNKQKQLQNE